MRHFLISRHQLPQTFGHFFMAYAFLDDDNDSVITGNSTQYFGKIAGIYVVSNAACIARARLDNTYVAREINGNAAFLMERWAYECAYTWFH